MKVTEKKSEQTRRRILTAAMSLFRDHGFEQSTMRDIAKKAEMALGGAYYYFDSKDAIVMAFYELAQIDLAALIEAGLANKRELKQRLSAVISAKFQYFRPNRSLLSALSTHIDPKHPLSPFSRETTIIRGRDIGFMAEAIEGSSLKVANDLKPYLPRILWLYQMGLILFWVYDTSPAQRRTEELFERSLTIVVGLIRASSLPLMRPLRKLVTDLLAVVYEESPSTPGLP